MLKFVSDHLKTKKMSKHVVKKLPYLWRYLPDQYATQRIGDKAILENGRTLKSVPDCYKNQEMRNKAVDNYPHGLKFALEREWSKVSKSEKKMCHEAVNTYPSVIQFIPECFMTQEMFDKAVN